MQNPVLKETIEEKITDEEHTFMEDVMASIKPRERGQCSLLHTQVALGHESDDAAVNYYLGVKAQYTLTHVGFKTHFKRYEGAAKLAGHWLKEPEEVEDLSLIHI